MQWMWKQPALAASLAALIAATPAVAQQPSDDAEAGTVGEGTQPLTAGSPEAQATDDAAAAPAEGMETGTAVEGDSDQPAAGAVTDSAGAASGDDDSAAAAAAADDDDAGTEMPGAATSEARGLSDLAEVPGAPEGDVDLQDGGQTVVLDIEGFAETIYERGYRQGYIRGVSDARQRFTTQMEQMQAHRQQMTDERARQRPEARPQQGARAQRERGSIIVLPPGLTPEMFIEELMRRNEQSGG